jgi:hypothetical protein
MALNHKAALSLSSHCSFTNSLVLNLKANPPSSKATMAGKTFQVRSKVFLKKTGIIPGIIRENQGSKTWKIELVDPNNGKPNSIYKDSVKSSDIRNLKKNEFPCSSEESAEQQKKKKKMMMKKKQTKKKDADESKEEEEMEAFKEPKIKWTKSKVHVVPMTCYIYPSLCASSQLGI